MAGFRTRWLGDERGYSLLEIAVVVAVISILVAIGVTLHAGYEQRARIARAQADARTVGSAIAIYAAHTGAIPTTSANMSAGLTTPTITRGGVAGPFLGVMPAPPAGGRPAWSPYTYNLNVAPGGATAAGAFVVCASGDGTFANSGGIASCP